MLLFLISQVDREDKPKIEYLFDRYHNAMMRIAKERLKRAGIKSYESDAEDVLQNAFLKICKYIKKIDLGASEKELRAYVLSIAANEANSFIADYKRVDPLGDEYCDVSDKDFFESLSIRENYDQVVKAIGELDEKYSLTLLYHYFQDMSVKDIAGLMGISEKTVYTRLSRGKKLLIAAVEGKKNV